MRSLGFTIRILMLASAVACGGGGSGGGGGGGGPVDVVDEGEERSQPNRSVAGSITAPRGLIVDSDTNDEDASYADNGSFDRAQAFESPATLGGHANQAGAGPTGRTYEAGDDSDFFRVRLSEGQRVQLSMAGDGRENDLDLELFGAARDLIDYSISFTPLEQVVAPADGEYYIRVRVFSGASSYVMEVGRSTAAQHEIAPMADFEPGEMIVRFRDSGVGAAAHSLGAMALSAMAGAPDREMLIGFSDPRDRDDSLQAMGAIQQATDWLEMGLDPDSETARKLDTLRALKRFRSRPDVHAASLNYRVEAFATPTDPHYTLQWHYRTIKLPSAWDAVEADSGIEVAVIDSGVVLGHPDLDDQLLPGFDFVPDADGIDADPDDPAGDFHGTHVAGTVAAETSFGGGGEGVAGVAWNASIVPVRVLDADGGSTFDVIQGVRFAGGLQNDSGITREPVDVINMSLGCPGFDCYVQTFQDVIHLVRANGTVVVAAAGNANSSVPSYPASYDGVISVAATGPTNDRAYYSNFGSGIDVAAPGGDSSYGSQQKVLSTVAGGSGASRSPAYGFMQGTSMASPHVAGVVALMLGVNPSLTPQHIDALLERGAITQDLGLAGRDDFYGHGLIDALAAVQAAADGTPMSEAILDVTPRFVDLASAATSASLSVRNLGGGALTDVQVLDDRSWLDVVPLDVDGGGLGTYSLRAERSALASGTHRATVTVRALEAGVPRQLTVEVSLTVQPEPGAGGNVGFIHVILVDPDTQETVQSVGASFDGGLYRYSFPDVEGGSYLVIGGTDYDHDRVLCDPAEACGGYPTLDALTPIEVDGQESGVDFSVRFLTEDAGMGASSLGRGEAAPAAGETGGFSRRPSGE